MNEKILLFLLGYNKYRDSAEVPFAVSQKGIAEGVEIRITHIPRAVQKLLDDDLLSEFKTHFRGHLRKRKAYFLTEKGTEKAQQVKENVGTRMVSLKTADDEVYEKKMLDMYEQFGSLLSFFEFYKLCTKNSTLDEAALEKFKSEVIEKEKAGSDEFKDFSNDIPEHKDVINRTNELCAINEWFASEAHRVLVLTGKKGMGKSTLAAAGVSDHLRDFHIFWLKFSHGETWESFAIGLAEFSSMNNFFKLEKYLKQSNNIIPSKTFKILAGELTDINLLVVLDDINNIINSTSELGAWLNPMLKLMPEWKIIITSSDQLPVELRNSEELEGKFTEIKIDGLDFENSRKLFSTDISPQEFEGIYNYTEGNPLFLKAIQEMEAEGTLDLKNFRPEELGLLKFLKVQEELE